MDIYKQIEQMARQNMETTLNYLADKIKAKAAALKVQATVKVVLDGLKGRVVVEGGEDAEFGTATTPPKPFVRSTVDEETRNLSQIIKGGG